MFCVLRALKSGFDQASSTQYRHTIWYHAKQNAITRNLEMEKRPQKFGLAQFAQSNFNSIIRIVPVVQNELACCPDGLSRIFAACRFREQIFGYWSEYNFVRLWSELNSVAFSWNRLLKILLCLASCNLKAIKPSILGTRTWSQNLESWCHKDIPSLLHCALSDAAAVQAKSFMDKWVWQILVQAC